MHSNKKESPRRKSAHKRNRKSLHKEPGRGNLHQNSAQKGYTGPLDFRPIKSYWGKLALGITATIGVVAALNSILEISLFQARCIIGIGAIAWILYEIFVPYGFLTGGDRPERHQQPSWGYRLIFLGIVLVGMIPIASALFPEKHDSLFDKDAESFNVLLFHFEGTDIHSMEGRESKYAKVIQGRLQREARARGHNIEVLIYPADLPENYTIKEIERIMEQENANLGLFGTHYMSSNSDSNLVDLGFVLNSNWISHQERPLNTVPAIAINPYHIIHGESRVPDINYIIDWSLCVSHISQYQYDEAHRCFDQLYSYRNNSLPDSMLIQFNHFYTTSCIGWGAVEKGIAVAQKQLNLLAETPLTSRSTLDSAMSLQSLSLLYVLDGKSDSALYFARFAKTVYDRSEKQDYSLHQQILNALQISLGIQADTASIYAAIEVGHSVISSTKRTRKYFEPSHYYLFRGLAYSNIGAAWNTLSQWETSASYIEQALVEMSNMKPADSMLLARNYANIAFAHHLQKNYRSAVNLGRRALEIELNHVPHHTQHLTTCRNLGLSYTELARPIPGSPMGQMYCDSSAYFFGRILAISLEDSLKHFVTISSLQELVQIHILNNQLDSAHFYYCQIPADFQAYSQNPEELAQLYYGTSVLAIYLEDWMGAIDFFSKGETIFKRLSPASLSYQNLLQHHAVLLPHIEEIFRKYQDAMKGRDFNSLMYPFLLNLPLSLVRRSGSRANF